MPVWGYKKARQISDTFESLFPFLKEPCNLYLVLGRSLCGGASPVHSLPTPLTSHKPVDNWMAIP